MKIEKSPEEHEFVNSLLSRQDEVIADLDRLEETILKVIDEIGDQRDAEVLGSGSVDPLAVASKAA